MESKDYAPKKVENSGSNSGVMAGTVNGDVFIKHTKNKSIPSILTKLIQILAEESTKVDEINLADCVDDLESFKIEDKIKFNQLKNHSYLIQEMSKYYVVCNDSLNIIDDNDSGIKKRILRSTKMKYEKIKSQLIGSRETKKSDIQLIQENADDIIDTIRDQLLADVIDDEILEGCFTEDIAVGIEIFLCYAFIECRILEKPR